MKQDTASSIGVGQKPETVRYRHQHITAFILFFLGLWLAYVFFDLRHAHYMDIVAFFQSPIHAALTLVFLAAALHHASIGLQNVALDYCSADMAIHKQRLIKIISMILMVVSILSILKIIFGV